jgi:tight adherence protein C
MNSELFLLFLVLFASVATASGMATMYVLRRTSPVDRRLRGLSEREAAPTTLDDLDLKRANYGGLSRVAAVLPKSHREMSALRRRLAIAGYDRPEAAVLFAAAEIGLPLLAFGAASMYFGPPRGVFFGLFAAAIAYLAPGLWLGQQMAKRKRQIQNGLPDALDLLLVMIEAGSGIDQAMAKIGQELQLAYPSLAREFRHIVTEMRAGRPRAEALRQFADRTKVEDVRALATMLIQTDKFGTSIGQALRAHAETARIKRRQRAEERAQKLGVKLVFPLVFCLFPAMYAVVLGPAALRIIDLLSNMARR